MRRSDVPTVSVEEMREVDRLAENEFNLALMQMMENAGRGLARLAREKYLGGSAQGRRVLVLAGSGGNGGGGLAAARRLHVWGADVMVILATEQEKLAPIPAHQYRALEQVGVELRRNGGPFPEADVILDALLGYSARGAPRAPMADLVRASNASPTPTLALDIPTGLDPETGDPNEPAIRADATLTLALPKTGLVKQAAHAFVGELWLADISIPPELYARLGLEIPALFSEDDLIRL